MNDIVPLLMLAIPATLLAVLFTQDRPRQIQRELAWVHLRQAGQLTEGMWRLKGRARRGSPLLVAPLSGRQCIAWRLVVAEDFLRDGRWGTAIDMCATTEFWVEDMTGRAFIEPGEHYLLALDPGASRPTQRGCWWELPATARDRVERLHGAQGVRTPGWYPRPGRQAHFTETTLEEDDNLCIGGEVYELPHPDGVPTPSRNPPMRLTFRGTAQNPLILTT